MPGGAVVGDVVVVAIMHSTVAAGSDVLEGLAARRGCHEAFMHSPRDLDAGFRYQIQVIHSVSLDLSLRSK